MNTSCHFMASVSWVRIRSSSLEAFVLDGVGWFPGTQVLECGIECTIVDFRKVVHSLGGSTQGPDIDRTRQPAISLLFWHILSCGMGCCLEHEFVNQLSIQTTFSDSQADYKEVLCITPSLYRQNRRIKALVYSPACLCSFKLVVWNREVSLPMANTSQILVTHDVSGNNINTFVKYK